MTLSKKQLEDKVDFQKYQYIWERDLLALAQKSSYWRDKAHELGFADEKIAAPWTFKDEGRSLRVGLRSNERVTLRQPRNYPHWVIRRVPWNRHIESFFFYDGLDRFRLRGFYFIWMD